jgi:hypothetical protein
MAMLTDLGSNAIGTAEAIVRVMPEAARIGRKPLRPTLDEPKVVDHV